MLVALLCGYSAAVAPMSNQAAGLSEANSYAVNVSDRMPSSAFAPAMVPPVQSFSHGPDSSHAHARGDYYSDIAADGHYTWKPEKFPIKVYMQPATGVPGYRAVMPDTLRASFNEWQAGTNGRVSWVEVDQAAAADITVSWTDRAVDNGRGTEGGRTKTFARVNQRTNKGIIDRAEMSLLTRLPDGDLSDTEMKSAYLHEVGHAFGLSGHSQTRGDIMFYAVGPKQRPALCDRDIATINRLYDGYPELARAAKSGSPKV